MQSLIWSRLIWGLLAGVVVGCLVGAAFSCYTSSHNQLAGVCAVFGMAGATVGLIAGIVADTPKGRELLPRAGRWANEIWLKSRQPLSEKIQGLHFSLRSLIGLMTFLAICCAALKYASPGWLMIISTTTLLLVMLSVIVSLFGEGTNRAFAGGFAICCSLYLVIFYAAFQQEIGGNREFLVSSWLLRQLSGLLFTTNVPSPMSGGMSGIGMGGMGGGFGGRGMAPQIDAPYLPMFMQIGQQLWAWAIGFVGGKFAVLVYRRRKQTLAPQI